MAKSNRCQSCDKPFQGRRDAKTCSARCRKRLERARRFIVDDIEELSGATKVVVRVAEKAFNKIESEVEPKFATEEGFIGDGQNTIVESQQSGPLPSVSPTLGAPASLVAQPPEALVTPSANFALSQQGQSINAQPGQTTAPEGVLEYGNSSAPQHLQESTIGNSPNSPSVLSASVASLPPEPLISQPTFSPSSNPLVEPNNKLKTRHMFKPSGLAWGLTTALVIILASVSVFIIKGRGDNQTPRAQVSNQTAQTPNVGNLKEESLTFSIDTKIAEGKTLTATGPVAIQNEADSDHALSVQTAAGANLLVADTKDKKVAIGGSVNSQGATLQITGDIAATGTITSKGTVLSSGGIVANGGSTSLSNQGLVINSVLVCTSSGCKTQGPVFNGAAVTLSGHTSGFYTNASNMNSGTLSDGLLSTNVDLLDADQTVSGNKTFTGINSFTAAGNTFVGDGSGLTSLNASNISSGTLADTQLSTNVALKNTANTFKADSLTALQIQNASGSSTLFAADTLNSKVGINMNPIASGAALQVNGDVDISGQYKVNGVVLGSGSLSDSGNLAKLDADQTFSGANTFKTATNAVGGFQIQNQAGNDYLFMADTINTRIGIGVAAPNYTLDINGDVNIASAQAYRVGGITICDASGCAPSSGSDNYVQLQSDTPGTAQTGHLNITGTAIAGSFYGSGLGLTNLDASQLASGTINDLRLSADVTTAGNTFNGAGQLVRLTGGGLLPALDASNLINLNASAIASGTLDDARLSGNVALKNASNQFTGANSFANDSTSAFQIQNAAGTSNLLVADTINSRVAIGQASANYTLDVNGDVNLAGGSAYRIGGVVVCDASGCIAGSGSSTYVQLQGGTPGTAQTGNFNINGAAIAGSFSGNGAGLTSLNASSIASGTLNDARLSSNVAKLDASQTFSGNTDFSNTVLAPGVAAIGSSLALGSSTATLNLLGDASSNFTVTSGGHNVSLSFNGTTTGDIAYQLDAAAVSGTYDICTTAGNCAGTAGGVTTAGGTSNKLAKFSAGQVIADSSISDTGTAVTVQTASNSATAFAIQNSAGTSNLFIADTANTRIAIAQATANYTLDVGGDINTTGVYRLNGAQISSANLSNDSNLAKLNAAQAFSGANTFNNASNSFTGDGSGLANVDATKLNGQAGSYYTDAGNINAGTLADTYLSSNVTLQGNTFNGAGQLVQLDGSGLLPVLNGSNLTDLNASDIASGTLDDARLSSNVALLAASSQTFTGDNTFANVISAPGLETTNSGHVIAVGFAGVATASVTYNFDAAVAGGAYTICTTVGNCAGVGGGVTTSGGTAGTIALFNNSNEIGDSILTQSGTTVTAAGDINTTGIYQVNGIQISSADLSNDSNLAKLDGTQTFSGANTFSNASNSFSGSGAGLTSLDGSNISSGTVADARLSNNVALLSLDQTFSGANIFNNASNSFTGDGSGLANVDATKLNGQAGNYYTDASNINSGTLSDNRLSTNVALKNADNTFTGDNTFTLKTATLSVQDASTPLGTDLFKVTSNDGTSTYFSVSAAGAQINGQDVCTMAGNCAGAGAGVTTIGGTTGTIALFSGAQAIANSILTQSGATITVGGTLNATLIQQGGVGVLLQNTTFGGTGGDISGTYDDLVIGSGAVTSAKIADATITDADISTTAGISYGKLTLTGSVVNTDISSSAAIAYSKLNLTGSITNSDIATSANISDSKLATITSAGKVADSALSSNVALHDLDQTFTGTNVFSNAANSFSGSGAGLTALNGSNISSGTVADNRLSSNVALKDADNIFSGNNSFSNAISAPGLQTTNSSHIIAVGFSGVATAALTYNFDATAPAGTYTICTTIGNCAGAGGGVTTPGGTTGTIALFNNSSEIGDSILTQSGTTVTAAGNINITGTYQVGGSQISSANLSNDSNLAKLGGTQTFTGANTFSNTSNSFAGNGSGLTSLDGTNIASGTVADARLSSNVALLNGTNAFSGSNSFSSGITAPSITTTGASLGVGSTTAVLNLAGNLSSNWVTSNGTNSVSVGFSGTPTANVTYNFDNTVAAGTYTICTTVGNCAGSGTGVTTSGGTTNKLAKFVAGQAIGNSIISDNGSTVTIGGVLAVNTITPTATLTVGTASQTLNLQGDASTSLAATAAGTTNSLVFATPSGAAHTITLPNASGTVAVSTSGPLSLDAAGNLTCPSCLTSGGGGGTAGVSSVNSATGDVVIQGTANQISVNASAPTITLSLPQDIATTSSPSFANLNVTTQYKVGGVQISSANLSNDANLAKLNGTQTFTAANTFSSASNSFTGNGSGLTSLNATNLASGTVASARIAGSYTGITGVGTITAGTWQGSVINPQYGGTGLGSYAVGDIIYASGVTTLAKLSDVASGSVLISGGVGTAPSWGKVTLGSATTGNYVATLGTLTGLSTTGNTGAGSTPTLSVTYGSTANTAVQGNTVLNCPAVSGNLSGGGNAVTLGVGGTCSAIALSANPNFTSVNVTSAYQVGGVQISSANLSNDSNLAKVNGNNAFTGNNTYAGTSTLNGATAVNNTLAVNTDNSTAFTVNNSTGGQVLGVDTVNQSVGVVNLQATGTISLQNGQGASIQLRTVSNSGTGANTMTFSGNEITDDTRSLALQGDGRQPPDSSTGIWEATTNLVPNGGVETDSTGWAAYSGSSIISRNTSAAKFGSASEKVMGSGTNNYYGFKVGNGAGNIAVSASTAYTASAWVKLAPGSGAHGVAIGIVWYDSGGASISSTVADSNRVTLGNNWIQLTNTGTSPSNAAYALVELRGVEPNNTYGFIADGVQLEQKSIATPYVETNGATAARSAARVQAPASNLNAIQGWLSMRIRMGWSSTAAPSSAYFMYWGTSTDMVGLLWNASTQQWRLSRAASSTFDAADVTTAPFNAGDFITLTFGWTSTQLSLSVNGGTFASVSSTHIPSLSQTLFDLGSGGAAVTGRTIDSDILWTAAGQGTLTNTDAASLNAYGNSDPTLSSLSSLNSGAATPTFAWDGEAGQYTGTNNTAISQSQLGIDDVNLTHTANGSLALQGATNSTTAFQVQNAAGTSIFTVDTTNSQVALGSGATPANSVLTVGTNTTTASGGITFGTDTNLYRSAAGVLKTDGSIIASNGTLTSTLTGAGSVIVSGSGFASFNGNPTVHGGIQFSNSFGNSSWIAQSNGSTALQFGSGSTVNLALQGTTLTLGGDTNLYRSAANTLKTDDTFQSAVAVQTPSLDTAAAGALAIGNTNATTISIATNATAHTINIGNGSPGGSGNTVTIGSTSASSSLTLQGGTGGVTVNGNTTISGANTFSTGTGNVALNGNTTVASGESFTANGAATFQNSANSATAFQVNNSTGSQVLGVDTLNQAVNVVNLQATGTISLQNGQGASIQLRTVSNSGTGSNTMTFSGNEITDDTRSLALAGDGRQPPDSSTGIWEATTNLVTNGGAESNATGASSIGGTTITKDGSHAKFGSSAFKAVTVNGNYGGLAWGNTAPHITVTPSTTYTLSYWIYIQSTDTGIRAIMTEYDSSGAQINSSFSNTTSSPLTTTGGQWVKVSLTGTTSSNAASARVGVSVFGNPGNATYWVDGVQLEQKAYATPYVETNGATASRNASRAQAPASNLNAVQSWVALRVRMGWGSSSIPASAPYAFDWQFDASNKFEFTYGSGLWAFKRVGAGTAGTVTTAQTFNAGDVVTLVVAWTSTQLSLSVNGSSFAQVAQSSPPASMPSTFDIGSLGTSNQLDSDILWTAAGQGTLTNTDAASLNAYGNSDPTLTKLTSLNSGAATPTFAWDGEATQYTGSNNSAISQSQLGIDDVNLTHTGNGSLALQGATNSTTAFQVQNATGDSIFNVNTASGTVAVYNPSGEAQVSLTSAGTNQSALLNFTPNGTGSGIITSTSALIFKTGGGGEVARISSSGNVGIGITNPQAALALGSDAGTAASGIKFGSAGDTNLYRSAANLLKTDDSLQIATNLGVGYDPTTISGGVAAFNGNVGIGTTSLSSYNLNVNGSANATTLYQNGQQVCDTSGNCTGVSGGSIGGSGTAGKIAQFTGSGYTVGDSILSQSGTTISVGGSLATTGNINTSGGALQTGGSTRIDNSGNLTNIGTINSGAIASSSTITGTTLNATTGINTGASGGTQRIDASGNLLNIGTIDASGLVTIGDLKTTTYRTHSLSRTMPTTVNDEVDLGSFALSNGAGNLDVTVTVASSGFSVAKHYILPVQYNQTSGAWKVALPLSDTGVYSSNNFDLDISVSTGTATLRIRRTAGATAGTAYVQIQQTGNGADVFTPSTSTSSVTAPNSYFGSSVISQTNNVVGINMQPTVGGSALQVAGDVNITGNYMIGGVQIASTNLSDSTGLARLSANQVFSGVNTFSSASNSFTGNGSGLTSLNASNISSGSLADARLSSNVPLKNAANTFSNANTVNYSSTAAFQVQNASVPDNLFIADTTNHRIAIDKATASYPLDVTGDINSTTGIRVAGNLVCTSTGCVAGSGSNFYVQLQAGTPGTAQTGNLNISGAAIAGNFQGNGSALTSLNGSNISSGTVADGRLSSNVALKNTANTFSAANTFTGTATFQNLANSPTAFQIQRSDTTPLLVANDSTGQITFPNATLSSTAILIGGDANLYRSATSTLKTDGNIVVAGSSTLSGNVSIDGAITSNTLQVGDFSSLATATPDTISLGGTYSNVAGANAKLKLYDDNGSEVYGMGVSPNSFDFMVPSSGTYHWYVGGSSKLSLDTTGNLTVGNTIGFANTGNANQGISLSMVVTTAVAANSVVVIDPAHAGQVTTTSVTNFGTVFGVATTTNASAGVTQPIITSGIYQVMADSGAVNVGDTLVSSATTGDVTSNSSPAVGAVLGHALSAKSAGSAGLVWVSLAPGTGSGDYTPVGTLSSYSGGVIPSGWLSADGSSVLRAAYPDLFNALVANKGTTTVTIASPGVFTLASHGLNVGDKVFLETTGALPTGLAADTTYCVATVPSSSTFTLGAYTQSTQVCSTTPINTSGTQSGTHTLYYAPYGVADSTHFYLPDMRGRSAVGINMAEVGRTDVSSLGNNEGVVVGSRTSYHKSTKNGSASMTGSNSSISLTGSNSSLYLGGSNSSLSMGGFDAFNHTPSSGGTGTGGGDRNLVTPGLSGSNSSLYLGGGNSTLALSGSNSTIGVTDNITIGPQTNTPTDTGAYLTVNYIIKAGASVTLAAANSFIQNGTATQTGNINIQSSGAGNVGAVIQGAVGQTADILDVRNSSNANLLSVDASGNLNVAGTIGFSSTGNNNQGISLSMVVTSAVTAGDVVVIDTTNPGQVTDSTSANSTKVFGIATQTHTAGVAQPIIISGVYQVNVGSNSVNVGDYLVTDANTGEAQSSTSPTGGVIGQALSIASSNKVWARISPASGAGGGSGGSGSSSANYGLMESDFTNTGATLPGGLSDSQFVTVGNNVYLLGGYDGSSYKNVIYSAPVSNPTNWTNTGSILPGVISGGQAAIIGSTIYYFGGYNGSANTNIIYSAPVSSPTTWSNTGSTLPANVANGQIVVIGSTIYLYGGGTGIYTASISNPLVWTTSSNTLPGSLAYSSLAVIGNYVYLFGGYNGSDINVIYRAPISSPTSMTNTGVTLPANVGFSAPLVVGSYVYLLGGDATSPTSTTSIYKAPITNPLSWSIDSNVSLPGSTDYRAQVAIIGNAAYMFGPWGTKNAIYSAPIYNGGPDVSGNPSWKVDSNYSTSGGSGTSSQTANGNTELAYSQFTSSSNFTATTEASANTIVSAPATTFDGNTSVIVNFYSPGVSSTPANSWSNFWLFDGGSSIGKIGEIDSVTGGYGGAGNFYLRITPTAGSHTYSVRGDVAGSGTSGTAYAGLGGAGDYDPGFIRITLANPQIQGGSGINNGTTTQTGNINIQSSSASNPTAVIQGATSQSADILDVKDGSGNIVFAVGPTGTITLGSSATTPSVLVLGAKTTAGDPSCTNGGIYYNSNSSQFRGCANGAYSNLAGTNIVSSVPTTNLYDGETVYLRVSAPADYLQLTYDAAQGHWYSVADATTNVLPSGTTLNSSSWSPYGAMPLSNCQALYSAGLRPQIYVSGYMNSGGTGTTTYIRASLYTHGGSSASPYGTLWATGPSLSVFANNVFQTANWADATYSGAPANAECELSVEYNTAGVNATYENLGSMVRWRSQ